MSEVSNRILGELEARGYRGSVVPIERIAELEKEIERQHNLKLFDPELYRVWLEEFEFEPPQEIWNAESLIITAVPHPGFRITFSTDRKSHSFIIPPTYLRYTDQAVADILGTVLHSQGYHFAQALVPAKLLVVRSGLGRYGRNNISYIEGMGSYFRLRAFYSDMPCSLDTWQQPQILEQCLKCIACIQACPTGAISSDRFLLHAERCIPFFNERDVEFPEWMDPSWHNSLIGCMICQDVCPVDRPFRNWVEDRALFSKEETRLILDGAPFSAHSPETQQKLKAIEWTDDLDILARNLRMLLDRTETSRRQED